jgi:hypothetical protein
MVALVSPPGWGLWGMAALTPPQDRKLMGV